LDKRYEEVLRDCPVKTFVFADRFPFRYLFDDYNVDYYAAFPGCSTETAASFEMIISLAEKLDELDSQFVFVTENSDRKIAESAIKASKNKSREILVLDSMQSVLINFGQTDRTYLSYMEKNLSVFLSVITPHEKS
jgi:zinc transport system substrate-binding protein